MIHKLAECPHCGSVVAVDADGRGSLIHNPDGSSHLPCKHLVGLRLYCQVDERGGDTASSFHFHAYWTHDDWKAKDEYSMAMSDLIESRQPEVIRFTFDTKKAAVAGMKASRIDVSGGAVFAVDPVTFVEEFFSKAAVAATPKPPRKTRGK